MTESAPPQPARIQIGPLQRAWQVFAGTLKATLVVAFGVALLACLWRYVDIQDRNSKAVAIEARIQLERHEAWKQAMQAHRAQATSEQLGAEVQQQNKAVPTLDAVGAPGKP